METRTSNTDWTGWVMTVGYGLSVVLAIDFSTENPARNDTMAFGEVPSLESIPGRAGAAMFTAAGDLDVAPAALVSGF